MSREVSGLHTLSTLYYCIKNGVGNINDNQDRTVGFMVRVRPPSRALDGSEAGPDGERALQLVEWASDLTEGWETLLVSVLT
jgi:hypothetical protein